MRRAGAAMVTETAMLDAIGLIYDAGLDPAAWPAALEHLAALLGANSAAVALLDPRVEVLHAAHVRADPCAMEAYVAHYRLHDPVLAALHARPAGQAIPDGAACGRAALVRSRFYGEWCRPSGFEHAMQGMPFRDAGGSGVLALCRGVGGEAFDAAEVAVLAALMPHVARALRVQQRLHAASLARDAMADALDRVPQAVLLVDARARVVHANRSAAALLRAPGGLDADAAGLRADRPAQTRALHALVARASAAPDGGDIVLDRADGAGRLLVHVMPVHAGAAPAWAGRGATAVVVVAQPGNPARARAALRALFGLTEAEARAACLVAAGSGVAAAAAALHVEPPTVRTQLLRAYAKTGTRRQAELADLVARLASAVGPG